jgi:tRNA (Thr-GGU) A37 N-methylase
VSNLENTIKNGGFGHRSPNRPAFIILSFKEIKNYKKGNDT